MTAFSPWSIAFWRILRARHVIDFCFVSLGIRRVICVWLFVTCIFPRPPSLQPVKIKHNKLTIICEDYIQSYTDHSLKFPLRKKQKQTNNTHWRIERFRGRICGRKYTMGSKHCVATWKQKFSPCIIFSKFRTFGEYLKFWDMYTKWYGLLRFGNRTKKWHSNLICSKRGRKGWEQIAFSSELFRRYFCTLQGLTLFTAFGKTIRLFRFSKWYLRI